MYLTLYAYAIRNTQYAILIGGSMSTLAARKGRSQSASSASASASASTRTGRDDASPTRNKEGVKSNTTSNTTHLLLGSFVLLLLAYFYHREGDLSLKSNMHMHMHSIEPSVYISGSFHAPGATVQVLQKQTHGSDSNSDSNSGIIGSSTSHNKSFKFVTIVMPSVVNPKQRKRRLEAITDTWGPTSRSIYVIHNVPEEYPKTHPIGEWPQILKIPPNITADDGLPRLYYVIRQVFMQYNNHADFFYFVNDHTYVIPEHLCWYLQNHHRDPTRDLYAGHALLNERETFNSGAAGYVLSHASMRRLVERFDTATTTSTTNNGVVGEVDANCVVIAKNNKNDNNYKWLQGNPGIVTAKCLHYSLDTHAIDTRESGKYHRFHAFGLVRSVMGTVDDWYMKKHANFVVDLGSVARNTRAAAAKTETTTIKGFDESYSKLLTGEACCSAETISFHYVESLENRALFQIRKALLQNPSMEDEALKDLMIQQWPKDRSEVGFYSQVLPAKGKQPEAWKEIMAVLRKISRKELDLQC